MKKAAVSKKYRKISRIAGFEQKISSSPWERATIKAVFFHAVKRRRDDVNFMAMLKPAYDGFVDAGIIEDDDADHLTSLPCEFRIDKVTPRVEITITRGDK